MTMLGQVVCLGASSHELAAGWLGLLMLRCLRIRAGGLSEWAMELVLKTSEQKCLVGSNPTPSARHKKT